MREMRVGQVLLASGREYTLKREGDVGSAETLPSRKRAELELQQEDTAYARQLILYHTKRNLRHSTARRDRDAAS